MSFVLKAWESKQATAIMTTGRLRENECILATKACDRGWTNPILSLRILLI